MSSSTNGTARALPGVLSAFLCVSVAPSAATAAEPTAAERSSARDVFVAGMALRDKGDHAGALAKFKEAYAFVPSPITALELGRSYAAVGKLVEAREKAIEAANMPSKPKESKEAKKARDDAATLAEALGARIPSIVVAVRGAQAGLSVTLDQEAISPSTLGAPRKVNPGAHAIVASRAGGAERRVEVTVKEGEVREVALDLPDAVAATAVEAEKAATPRDDAKASTSGGTSTWTYVGFGVAGVGLVVGSVTGIMAMSKHSSLKSDCGDRPCPSKLDDDVDAYHRLGAISTISFVAAGVGAAVGVIGLLSSHGSEGGKSARVEPWVAVGAAGLRGRF